MRVSWVLGRRVCLWMTACTCSHPRLFLFFVGSVVRHLCFLLLHHVSLSLSLNEKQLVSGGVAPAVRGPCVRVRRRDEMAEALIVWHRAVAAFCQKSSSDSPTGMMAHLTNASPPNGPTTSASRSN